MASSNFNNLTMAFQGKFTMTSDGTSITHRSGAAEDGLAVLQCTFSVSRSIDVSTGYTQGAGQAGLIHIDIESSKNPSFVQWLVQNQRGDGAIVFYTTDNHGAKVEDLRLEFTRATLVEYRETFDSTTAIGMTTHLEIFAQGITINDEVASEAFEWGDER